MHSVASLRSMCAPLQQLCISCGNVQLNSPRNAATGHSPQFVTPPQYFTVSYMVCPLPLVSCTYAPIALVHICAAHFNGLPLIPCVRFTCESGGRYETRNHIWLIMEYCTGGDLLNLLLQDTKLPEKSIVVFGASCLSHQSKFLPPRTYVFLSLRIRHAW
jgi:serine/threonine protein kinase